MSPRPGGHRPPPLILIFTITATGLLANSLITPAVPDIVEDLGASQGSWNGILVAAGAVPGILVAPAVGVLADRYGRRPVLLACLTVFGVFGTLGALAPSLIVLAGLRVLQGAGGAGLVNLAVVVISDNWSGVERARLIGINAAVLTASVAVFPAVGGAIADALGWRWIFVCYGGALLTAAAVARWLQDHAVLSGDALATTFRRAIAVSRRLTVAPWLVAGTIAFVAIFGLMLVALPNHLDTTFGQSAGARGRVLAVPALGSTLAALTLGRLRRRWRAESLVTVGLALFAVTFVVIGFADRLVAVVAVTALYGLGEGISIPSLQDLVASRAPDDLRGSVLALWVGFARLGQTVGPLVVGVIIGAVDATVAFQLGAVMMALTVAGLVLVDRRVRGLVPAAT